MRCLSKSPCKAYRRRLADGGRLRRQALCVAARAGGFSHHDGRHHGRCRPYNALDGIFIKISCWRRLGLNQFERKAKPRRLPYRRPPWPRRSAPAPTSLPWCGPSAGVASCSHGSELGGAVCVGEMRGYAPEMISGVNIAGLSGHHSMLWESLRPRFCSPNKSHGQKRAFLRLSELRCCV